MFSHRAESLSGCVDLHTHTDESDGTFRPAELVALANDLQLDAIAITDHETFSGYELAAPLAANTSLDLIRGIELNTTLSVPDETRRRALHLLAYFPVSRPSVAFLSWLEGQRDERRERNRRLAKALQNDGIDISLEEVEARGKTLAGRPHFAKILVEKGYANDHDDAFRRYLGEDAPTFMRRQSQTAEKVIGLVRDGGGVPVVAHPIRLSISAEREPGVFARLKDAGLMGLEVAHSEHSSNTQAHYWKLANDLQLLPTGGSDFHGAVKPGIELGIGANNIRVPRVWLDNIRAALRAA